MSAAAAKLPLEDVRASASTETDPRLPPKRSTQQQLAAALAITQVARSKDYTSETPYENCLAELLEAMDWMGPTERLVEALPHVDSIDNLETLAIVLRRLGYEASAGRRRRSSLTENDFPAAYMTTSGPSVAADLATFRSRDRREDAGRRVQICSIQKAHRETRHYAGRGATFLGSSIENYKSVILGALTITAAANCLALATPLFAMSVYNLALPADAWLSLVFFTVLVLLALGTEDYLKRLRGELIANMAMRLHTRVMRDGVRKALHLPLSKLDKVSTAAQLAQFKRMENILGFFQSGTANAVIDAPMIVIFLLVIGFWGGLLVLVPLTAILAFILLAVMAAPSERVASINGDAARRQARELLRETVVNAAAIREAGVEELWLERLSKSLDSEAEMAAAAEQSHQTMTYAGQTIVAITSAATLGVGAMMVMDGALSVGAMIAASILNARILSPVQSLVQSGAQLRNLREDVTMINQMFALDDDEAELGAPRIDRQFKGHLKVDRVGYRFPEAPDFALRNLSFEVRPGERLAIVGPTGAGKSLLLRVVSGLITPTLGTVSLDGLPMSQIKTDETRRVFGYAPIRPEFFYGTIAQNMRFARADITDFEIEEMLDAFAMPLDLERFPEGVETRLTEQRRRELGVSALQKLNIARALLSRRPILVIDNVFPDLDATSRKAVLARLDQDRGVRTTIVAGVHRELVETSETTLALKHGAIAAYGPSAEVLPLITRN